MIYLAEHSLSGYYLNINERKVFKYQWSSLGNGYYNTPYISSLIKFIKRWVVFYNKFSKSLSKLNIAYFNIP